MTESVLPHETRKSNRVDPPHDLLTTAENAAGESNPWMVYAGRDPESMTDQIDRQTSELMSYVKDQNREIDARQAELNAKLAQLDSQLRNARLRQVDDMGADLLANVECRADDQPAVTTEENTKSSTTELEFAELGFAADQVSNMVSQSEDPLAAESPSEFDEVDRIVAQFTDSELREVSDDELWEPELEPPPVMTAEEPRRDGNHIQDDASQVEAETSATPTASPVADNSPAASKRDAFPDLLAGSHLGRVDSTLVSDDQLDSDAVAAERRILAERKLDLDRQQSVVNRLQEETQALHREALEMRIVTEQLWAKLSKTTSPAKLKELIGSLRSRLDQHYAREQETLESRKQEISGLQSVLEEKQQSIRQQSTRMQEWFASREQDIRTYANEVDARAALLDRREHRLESEFAKWEAERRSYEEQLQGLAQRIQLSGIQQ